MQSGVSQSIPLALPSQFNVCILNFQPSCLSHMSQVHIQKRSALSLSHHEYVFSKATEIISRVSEGVSLVIYVVVTLFICHYRHKHILENVYHLNRSLLKQWRWCSGEMFLNMDVKMMFGNSE